MANRFPLIVDSSSQQIKELPDGDSLLLGDNEKLIIGDGLDLQLYHDGTNHYITATGGILNLTNNDVRFKTSGGETMLRAQANGEVELMYDNSTKIATTTTGMSVTGNVVYTGSSLTVEDTLTDGSTITWNAINSPVAKVTLAGNRTITVSNNLGTGQYISVLVIQDGTGSRTLTWNAMFEFKDDTAPTLTTNASKGDLFTFRYNGAKWLEVGRNQNLSLS